MQKSEWIGDSINLLIVKLSNFAKFSIFLLEYHCCNIVWMPNLSSFQTHIEFGCVWLSKHLSMLKMTKLFLFSVWTLISLSLFTLWTCELYQYLFDLTSKYISWPRVSIQTSFKPPFVVDTMSTKFLLVRYLCKFIEFETHLHLHRNVSS